MQHPPESSPSGTPSFAGLLASIAETKVRLGIPAQGQPATGWAADWNDSGLQDDVATLSYEQALRTHGRYRAPDLSDRSLTGPPEPLQFENYELAPEETLAAALPAAPRPAAPAANPGVKTHAVSAAAAAPAWRPSTLFERNLKSASVTVRMSQEECEQLHRRAADAGLTVSAYLRSCTFEAESLRALVKETMAQLKSATAAGMTNVPVKKRQGWLQWLKRMLNPWQGGARTARA